MNGIGVDYVPNPAQPERREKFYLSTRRTGEGGEALRKAKRKFREAKRKITSIGLKLGFIERQAQEEGQPPATLERMLERIQQLVDDSATASEEAQAAAEKVVRLALRENHGDQTDEILNSLTDAQVVECVSIIETGEVPEDFFPRTATPPKPSTTTPDAGAPSESCSSTDSPEATSTPDV